MGYIYEQLSTTEVARRLKNDPYAGWSYEGALALAEYLAEYVEDTDENMELDIVAIRCDFSEYEDLANFNQDTGSEFETIEDLQDNTTVIHVENTGKIIVRTF